jgi:hypothetical protein
MIVEPIARLRVQFEGDIKNGDDGGTGNKEGKDIVRGKENMDFRFF